MNRLPVAAIATVVVLSLTGCAAPQTVAEACAVVRDQVSSLQTQLREAAASGDPAAAGPAIKRVGAGFAEIADGLHNPEVREALTSVAESITHLGVIAQDAAEATDLAEVERLQQQAREATSIAQARNQSLAALCG